MHAGIIARREIRITGVVLFSSELSHDECSTELSKGSDM